MRGFLIFLGLLFFTPILHAQVLWEGNFESNDLSEFGYKLNPVVDGKDYTTVVEDIVSQGKYAVRIELHDDARWSNGLRRVELQHSPENDGTAEGKTTYYAWSIYLPKTLSENPTQQIGYWESNRSFRQMMAFTLKGDTLSFATRQPTNKVQWTGEGVVVPEKWHRIGMRIKWSKNVDLGEVDIWFDGAKVVDAAKAKTLNDDNSHFAQFGLLRGNADFDDVPVIYIDDAVEGLTLEDIRIDALLKPTIMDEDDVIKDMGSVAPSDMNTSVDMKKMADVSQSDMPPNVKIDMDPVNAENVTGTGSCSMTRSPSSFGLLVFALFFFVRRRSSRR